MRRNNAHVVSPVAGALEVLDSPSNATDVLSFLPRLEQALAGSSPLMVVPRSGQLRELLLVAVRSAAARPIDDRIALVVPTSGSTGVPRLALLSGSALVASADATHRALGGRGRWLLALPTTHIAGLQVLVRSLRSGLAPAVLDVSEPFTVERFVVAVAGLDASTSEHPHYCAVVPTQLQRLLDDGAGIEALWQLDAVLVGGAAVSPGLLERARDAGVPIVRTYGMTETSGGCVYDGVPIDGVDVAVGDDGRVLIRGPVLFDGYLDGGAAALADGWFVTSDIGRIADRVLSIEGRADNVINTGGVKVSAESVERALLGLPGVRDAVVVGVADPEWGERVVAVVTAASEASALDVDVVPERLRGQVPNEWLPRTVVCVEALPVLASGKPDRVAARRLVADLER